MPSCRALTGRALDIRPLRWVGVRSYGIYLWHWPVLLLITAAEPAWQDDATLVWALGGITVAITLVASELSYRFVEVPIRARGFRTYVAGSFRRGPHRAARTVTAMACAVALVGAPQTRDAVVMVAP